MKAIMSQMLLLGALGFIMLLGIRGEVCDSSKRDKFDFNRIFIVMAEGPADYGNRTTFAQALGNCLSTEELSDKMIAFYSEFGLNMNPVRRDPYTRHNLRDFVLDPLVDHLETPSIVTAGAFFDHTISMNEPLNLAVWDFVAKRNITGPKGLIPAGYTVFYGHIRFRVHSQYFCFELKSRVPTKSLEDPNIGAQAQDFLLYNEVWKEGSLHGVFFGYSEGRSLKFKQRAIITFPATEI